MRTTRWPAADQAFEQIVDRGVAGRTGQHFVAARDGLADERHDRSGLARARWTVNDRDVLGGQGELDRGALRRR